MKIRLSGTTGAVAVNERIFASALEVSPTCSESVATIWVDPSAYGVIVGFVKNPAKVPSVTPVKLFGTLIMSFPPDFM